MTPTAGAPRIAHEVAVSPQAAHWQFAAEYLKVSSAGAPELVDVTAAVESVVARSGVAHGQAVIFCRHTTASVVLNEDEPLLHEDIRDFMESLASSTADYRHDDFTVRTENLVDDHGRNAHAHLKHLVLGASVVVPVLHGKLALGEWQRIFLLEMDKPKPRTLLVQVCGARPA